MRAPGADRGPTAAAGAGAMRNNLVLLVQLRWIAVAGQLTTIGVVEWGLQVRLPLHELGIVLAVCIAGNLASMLRLRRPDAVTNRELFFTLVFDVTVLTALLFFSGGATNPFTSLYLLQVILGAVLLEAWASWAVVAVAGTCLFGLAWRYWPLVLPPHGPSLFALYIAGGFIGFVLDAVLLVIFINRISANLRHRDERLAALRQRAAEEDHIVRMGLLASGAAHELGTPLSTLDVILGDWLRMPKLAKDPELAAEIEEMQSEVARCKAIVTGVLVLAGETRAETAGVSTLKRYLADLFEDWRSRRSPKNARYEDDLPGDFKIVADSALTQALNNLLDNAFEASPDTLAMRVALDQDQLVVRIEDAGPGFTPGALADVGKPYNSTKGRLGGGLGLFLVVNVVRKLGGKLEVRNRRGGGAEAVVRLPLNALVMEAES